MKNKPRQMHPTVSALNAHLKKTGLKRWEVACLLIDYLPDGAKRLQGSGEERTCSDAHKKQVYRMLSGKHTPRKDMLTAMANLLADQ